MLDLVGRELVTGSQPGLSRADDHYVYVSHPDIVEGRDRKE